MKLTRVHAAFAVLIGCLLVAAAVVWASESAPSNTVGFYTFELTTSAP